MNAPSTSLHYQGPRWNGVNEVNYGDQGGKGEKGKGGKKGKYGKGQGAVRGACNHFMSSGTCTFGDACSYDHSKKAIAAAQKGNAGKGGGSSNDPVAEVHQTAKAGKNKKGKKL